MTWPQVVLGDVIRVMRSGISPEAIKGGTTYVGLEHIDSAGSFNGVRAVDPGELASTKFSFSDRHVLFGKLRPYLRKTARPDFNGVCSTDILPLEPGSRVDRDYLFHALRRQCFVDEVTSLCAGANLPRISPKVLASLTLPLPPLAEQRRIAAILDKADALRAKRREAIAKLDQLLQSVFLDMFGDPVTNPKGWPETSFGEMFDISSSKRVLESQWRDSGIPFYRAREIAKLARTGRVEAEIFISDEMFEEFARRHSAPQSGDLMVSAVGTLGACYQVQDGDRFYFKDASVLRFVPIGNTVPEFVRFAFTTDHVLRQVHSGSSSTVGTYTINRARDTRLFSPPLVLQRQFATFMKRIGEKKRVLQRSAEQLNALFASLQQRAFSGNL